MQRIAANYREIEENIIEVSGLTKSELEERLHFFDKKPLKVGRQWVVLHRSTVEWMLNSMHVKKILDMTSKFFISDEIFYQMALFSDENPNLKQLSKDNLRYKLGSPVKINKDNIQDVLNSEKLFARKVNIKQQSEVYLAVKEHGDNGIL